MRRLVLIDPFAFLPWYFKVFVHPRIGHIAYHSTFANPVGRWLTNASLRNRRAAETDLTGSFRELDHDVSLRYLEMLDAIDGIARFSTISAPVDIAYGERTFAAVKQSVEQWRGAVAARAMLAARRRGSSADRRSGGPARGDRLRIDRARGPAMSATTGTGPVVSITFCGYRGAQRLWAFNQMGTSRGHLARVDGLRFWRLLGTGHGRGFSLRPDFSRYGVLAVWESHEAADAFSNGSSLMHEYRRLGVRSVDGRDARVRLARIVVRVEPVPPGRRRLPCRTGRRAHARVDPGRPAAGLLARRARDHRGARHRARAAGLRRHRRHPVRSAGHVQSLAKRSGPDVVRVRIRRSTAT